MKKTLFYNMILVLSFLPMLVACSADDDSQSNSAQIAQIKNIIKSGTWRITNFIDSGQNETNNFSGYNFSFNADGILIATNASNSITGSWNVSNDSSGSDDDSSNSDDIDFNIFFSVAPDNDFYDLVDDWDIVTSSSTKIELIDISGGNGGTDMLTFERN